MATGTLPTVLVKINEHSDEIAKLEATKLSNILSNQENNIADIIDNQLYVPAPDYSVSIDETNILSNGDDGRPKLTIDVFENSIQGVVDTSISTVAPSIDPETRNWLIGNVDTGYKAVGEQGPAGIQGIPGQDGRNMSIDVTFASIDEMTAAFDSWVFGTWAMINTGNVEDEDDAKLFFRDTTEWRFVVDLSGMEGVRGKSAFEIFLELNPDFEGDESDWLNSLKVQLKPIRYTDKERPSIILTGENYVIPEYVVGQEELRVYLVGLRCYEGVQYEEVGNADDLSTIIRWLIDIPTDYDIDIDIFRAGGSSASLYSPVTLPLYFRDSTDTNVTQFPSWVTEVRISSIFPVTATIPKLRLKEKWNEDQPEGIVIPSETIEWTSISDYVGHPVEFSIEEWPVDTENMLIVLEFKR